MTTRGCLPTMRMMSNRQDQELSAPADFLGTLNELADIRRKLAHAELRGLSDIGRESEESFLAAWQAIDTPRRRQIVRAMVTLAEDNVDLDFRDAFVACLDDQDALVRQSAIEGLWEDDRPRVMRRLLALLHEDEDEGVRATAALGLGRFAYQAALEELPARDAHQLRETLVRAASDLDLPVEVRRRALEGAGYFSGQDVDQAIAGAYATGAVPLKASALAAIGHSLDTRWLPIIQAELGSSDPALRFEAARAAGELGSEAAALVPLLVPLAQGDDAEIYVAAIWALGQVGGEAARRVLRGLAKSDELARQAAASDALSELELDAGSFGLF